MLQPLLRIFVSSPGDVGLEREICARVIERLRGKFGSHYELEAVRWEDRPVRATDSFQPQIVPPSETDLVVCILWSRLGTPLSEQFRRSDGSRYGSGTEWEFEDAARSYRERGRPDLLVYRRTKEPEVGLKDPTVIAERQAQYQALEAFISRWFFNDDGTFKAAFKTYERVEEFERRLEADLNQLLMERLSRQGSTEDDLRPAIRWTKGSPFLGLNAFDLEHAGIFHGRTRAVAAIREAMVARAASGCAAMVVFGMSGCGKSSLVRAGVVATITRPGVVEGAGPWRWCQFRPSDAPDDLFRGLASAILGDGALAELRASGVDASQLAAILSGAPEHAAVPIAMALRRAAEGDGRYCGPDEATKPRLLVVVDQLEELFTLGAVADTHRRGFARALEALARSGHAWVIATMRSDFYHRCAEVPELVSLKEGGGQYDLLPPSFDEIGQIIAWPAQAAGLRFEQDREGCRRLDSVLHEAASRVPESLPLLSFVLDELYRERVDAGTLTFAAYGALGGLDGAIARRAEAVFADQSPEARAELRPLIRGLATVEPGMGDVVVSRRVPIRQVASAPPRRAMLDAMVSARLLVTDRAEDGTPVVRVAHEALLTSWPRVAAWLEEDREFLRVRARVAEQAARWAKEKRRPDLLLPAGKPLAEAEALVAERAEELDPGAAEFVAASSSALRRRRRRRIAIASALAATVTAAGLISYKEWDDGRKARAKAEDDQAAAAREAKLGRDLQETNRQLNAKNERKAKEFDFRRFNNDAGVALIGKRPQAALESLTKALTIAEPLANEPSEDQGTWLDHFSEALEKTAEAQFAMGQFDEGKRTLERRAAYFKSLPESVRTALKIHPTGEIGLSDYQVTAIRIQLELSVANAHLKALMRQSELLKEALRERLAGRSLARAAQPAATAANKEADRKSIDSMLNLIAFAEFVAMTTMVDTDRQMLDLVYQQFGPDVAGFNDYAEYGRLIQRRLDFNQRMIQALEAHQSSGRATPEQTREKVADVWLSTYRTHLQAGDVYTGKGDPISPLLKIASRRIDPEAALAHYGQALETLDKTPITPKQRDGVAAQVADVRFRIAGLLKARHDEDRARKELGAGVGLLLADGEAAVRDARRRLVDRHRTAAEEQARLGDVPAARASYRTAIDLMTRLADETGTDDERQRLIDLHGAYAGFLLDLKEKDSARASYEAAVEAQRAIAEATHDPKQRMVLANGRDAFGRFLRDRLDAPARAIEQFRGAVAALGEAAGPGDRRVAFARLDREHQTLLQALRKQKDPGVPEAVDARARSLGAWRDALASAPDMLELAQEWKDLSAAFRDADDGAGAIGAFDRAVTVRERLAAKAAEPAAGDDLIAEYFELENTCLRAGNRPGADSALARARAWVEGHGTAARRPAEALDVIVESARIKLLTGDRAAAIGFARDALARPDPGSGESAPAKARLVASSCYRSLGSTLADLEEKAAARQAFERAVASARRLAADPKHPDRKALALAYEARAGFAWDQDDFRAALADFDAMLEACPALTPLETAEALDLHARAVEGRGVMHDLLKHDQEARADFDRLLDLRRRHVNAAGNVAAVRRLDQVYERLLRFAKRRDDDEGAARASKLRVEALEPVIAGTNDPGLIKILAGDYVYLSWYSLLLRRPSEAIAAAKRGMELEPDSAMLATNLAHGQLFLGHWDEAAAIYRKFRGTKVDEKRSFEEAVREDFREFRKRGLTHPDMERAERILDEPKAVAGS